jgi:hypothetical protein
MNAVAFAATKYGYVVQVIDNGIVCEYAAGNCRTESQTVINPNSSGVVSRSQLRRWAEQTAKETADEWQIPVRQIEYDPDLEAQLELSDTTRKSLDHAVHTV